MRSKLAMVSTLAVIATTFMFPTSAWAAVDFTPAVNYGTDVEPVGVARADFDGDGNADLVTANYSADTVSLLLGNGDGTFAAAVNFPTGDGPQAVAAGDFNGDSQIDVVTANYYTNDVTVLLGLSGTFTGPASFSAGLAPQDVTVGDLDTDGDLDLAVANTNSNNVSVLLNNGVGTFAAAVNYAAGTGPVSVVMADLDGDSDLDLAVANLFSGDVNALLNIGGGVFAPAINSLVGGTLGAVAVGDLDGDGKLDLAVTVSNSLNVTLLLGNGDGTFTNGGYVDTGSGPRRLAIDDFDGDAKLDLAVPNSASTDISVFFGNGDGTFAPAVSHAVGSFPQQVALGDFNGDSKTDLATANSGSDNVSVLLNDPNFKTGPTATISGTVRQGQTLTAHEGTPVPTQDSFSYKWFANGVEIVGQTAGTLLLTSAHVGKKISVEVTAIKAGLNDASDTSPETVPVVGIFTPGPTASISGFARVGSTLTANTGSPSPTPTTLGYRWFADGVQLSQVTKTLTLTSAHRGKRIQVRVYAIKSGYLTASNLSPATAAISSLQAKTISLELNDYTVRRGQRVDADIELLAPGEPWSIVLDGKTLASGKASSKGTVLTSFVIPTNATIGERTIRANGAFPDRTDPDRITVR